MISVSDLINRNIYAVEAHQKVHDLLRVFVDKQVSGVPVTNNDRHLVGIITAADILREIHEPTSLIDVMTYVVVFDTDAILSQKICDLLNKPVSELMTKKVITVTEDTLFSEVAQILSRKKFKKLPVVKGKKLVGIVSRSDVVRYLVKEFLDKKPVK